MLDTRLPPSGLVDRLSERDVLERLVAGVRAGQSRVLVLCGQAGVGKTALLGHLSAAARGCRVARAAGVESEMELPFAGVHALCAHMLDRLGQLPSPQRDALSTAFGLSAGPPPDRFLVGLAVLSLLADTAEERPLICIVDDAQWLDWVSAQTLAFVARRLLAERVGLVFALRESGGGHDLEGLPELEIEGLAADDARQLLDATLAGPLDGRVRERILAEADGNPLALLELPRGLTPTAAAGGYGLPGEVPLTSRIQLGFARQLEPLPAETRRLLLAAAAEPVGDVTLLWRAVERLGISPGAAAAAETSGLIQLGALVRFRHPLARSAVYRSASPQERREVHGALAEVIDPEIDPDRRAWHRAHAAHGSDDDVAAELDRSASRAQARGGLAAAAAFHERAAELTPEPARRAQRALAAAQAKLQAGGPEDALRLLGTAEVGPLDELQRARAELLRAQIAFTVNRGPDAPPLLLSAAKRLEALDVTLARDTYLDALAAATFVGRLADGVDLHAVARAARAAPPAARPPRAADLLLDGMALMITEGYAAGGPVVKRAVSAFRDGRASADQELRWLWLAAHAALDLWDDETWSALAIRHVEIARAAGALAVLPTALNTLVGAHLNAGELTAAGVLLEEVKAVAEVTGSHPAPYVDLALAAFRGHEAHASQLLDVTMKEARRRGEGIGLTVREWAAAMLYNSLGRYEDALAAAELAAEHPDDLRFSTRALVELIEAAVRSGNPGRAADALERLEDSTRAGGTEFGLGSEARSRALISDGETADGLYREAIDRFGRTRSRWGLARARLLYGEWLRRERRRVDAREQLRTAHDLFTAMGMHAFGERAARELLATGETARKRSPATLDDLTAQEAQIARLASDGQTNPEIAARLYISPRTVEYHLHKVFTKLGITSRRALRMALPADRALSL